MRKQYNLINLLVIAFALTLSGCSFFTPVKSTPDTLYTLERVPFNVATRPTKRSTILIMQPEALPIFDSTQIAFTKKPFTVGYYSQNRWAVSPSQMLQPLLVQTLQRTHHFRAVVTAPYVGQYDYILNTQILRLIQDFKFCPALLRFYVKVQLMRSENNRIVTTAILKEIEPLPFEEPYGGVVAANIAVSNLLEDIAALVVKHTP